MAGLRRIPVLAGIEMALHVPRARRVVDRVLRRGRAERRARVEVRGAAFETRHIAVEVVPFDEFAQVCAAHVVAALTECVVQVERVDAQLVGNRRVTVVGHTARHPVVAADRLDVPDFVDVADDDAIRLVRADFLKQAAEALHAFARGADIRQHDRDDVLFAEPARRLLHIPRLTRLADGRLERHEWIGRKHARIDGDRLGGAHRHIVFIDAGLCEHAAVRHHVRHDAVAAGVGGQVELHVADHTAVVARLVGRRHGHEMLGVIGAAARIVVAGDDGGSVITG